LPRQGQAGPPATQGGVNIFSSLVRRASRTGTVTSRAARRAPSFAALIVIIAALALSQALFAGASTAEEAPPQPTAADTTAATTGDNSASAGDLLDCTGNQKPANFTVYSLGPSVNGQSQTEEQRDCEPYSEGDIARMNYVGYTYGSCEIPAGESVCAPPLEIQSWPACERNLAMYEKTPGTPYPDTYLGEVRGAPAYSFNGGTRIEVYSSDTTIVIFATDPGLATAALDQIQPESVSQPPPQDPANQSTSGDLPAPEDGSTTGTLTCE
jgi:hypothetical protein